MGQHQWVTTAKPRVSSAAPSSVLLHILLWTRRLLKTTRDTPTQGISVEKISPLVSLPSEQLQRLMALEVTLMFLDQLPPTKNLNILQCVNPKTFPNPPSTQWTGTKTSMFKKPMKSPPMMEGFLYSWKSCRLYLLNNVLKTNQPKATGYSASLLKCKVCFFISENPNFCYLRWPIPQQWFIIRSIYFDSPQFLIKGHL